MGNDNHFIKAGINNIGHSLEIISVKNAILYEDIGPNGKAKAKLSFNYNGIPYNNMSITDQEYFGVPNGTLLGDVILVVSLPDDDWSRTNGYYKFIAKILKTT